MQDEWALVGREAELAILRRLLARRHDGGLMLARGPGAGKRRMLREYATLADGIAGLSCPTGTFYASDGTTTTAALTGPTT